MANPPPPRSADGQWFWDGTGWRSLVSADGQSIWDGTAWTPRPPGSTVSPPPAGPPGGSQPAAMASVPPAAPAAEPRPAWLPADAAWPPPAHSAAPPPPPGPPPPPIDWAARREAAFGPAAAYPSVRYAGFWIRFLAAFLDGIIVAIPVLVIAFALDGSAISQALANQSSSNPPAISSAPVNGISFLLSFGYFAYFWSTGQTLAMRIFGLQVVDAGSLAPIGFGRAALRYVGYLVSSFCCYIGLIWAAFDARKQGWHDKIASTVVVYR